MSNVWIEVVSGILLYCLVFGMSATVELDHMKKQITNSTAICIGIGLQFFILPFIGFIIITIFHLPSTVGITLLVITSSPGGSYSNWWCSMFNADLALSVTMTAMSTILSTILLPMNLILYTKFTYSATVVQSLDWYALFISLIIVLGGIISGLFTSHIAKMKSMNSKESNNNNKNYQIIIHKRANRMGNIAGMALILLSITVSSSNQHAALWDQNITFYIACALPPIIGLCIAISLASYNNLDKPECVAVSIESCYQNTGIATTVALTMFQTEQELATAIGVPLYYGIIEAIAILSFCLISWKIGWTKAPINESLCTIITTSYEVEIENNTQEEDTAIEVVLSTTATTDSTNKQHNNNNLIFSQTDQGDYIIDELTLHDIEMSEIKHKNKNKNKNSYIENSKDHDDLTEEVSESSNYSHHQHDNHNDDNNNDYINPVKEQHQHEEMLENDSADNKKGGNTMPSITQPRRRRRHRAVYGALVEENEDIETTTTPTTLSAESDDVVAVTSEDIVVDDNNNDENVIVAVQIPSSISHNNKNNVRLTAAGSNNNNGGGGRFGRTISTIRARATGYHRQTPLTSEDDEHDISLHTERNTELGIISTNSSAINMSIMEQQQQDKVIMTPPTTITDYTTIPATSSLSPKIDNNDNNNNSKNHEISSSLQQVNKASNTNDDGDDLSL